ncbi:unnamed protein product [Somion occarium]|uniref:Uncharacterized protein n=1 Tax=Somion occarium TaxID=3059160 RepID=A0ABP1DUB2_9APHY
MSDRTKDTRPAKRARLFEPDGFSVSKPPQKVFPRVEFVSSFDIPAPENAQDKTTWKVGSVHPLSSSTKTAKPSTSGQKADVSRRPVYRVLKPPPRPTPEPPLPTTTRNGKNFTPLSSTRPMLPSSKDSEPPAGKPLSRLVRPLPNPVSSSSKPSKPLKPLSLLKPPVRPSNRRPKPDPSTMKTISTTNIAIATNPFTAQGSLNLFALFAKEMAADYMTPREREMRRGLLQSPEKATRNKKQKFIPGGLADNARLLCSQSRTGLSLWEKDIRSHAKRGIAPEVRLRILSLIYTTPPHTQSHQPASRPPVVAIIRTKVEASRVPNVIKGGELFVMVRLDPPAGGPPRALKEDSPLWIWRPWFTVPLPPEIEGMSTAIGARKLVMCNRFHIPK